MTLPSLKTLRQWLPFVCRGFLVLWVSLLVLLSLFPSTQEPMQPGASPLPAHGAKSGCVSMPDGFLICDDIPNTADRNT